MAARCAIAEPPAAPAVQMSGQVSEKMKELKGAGRRAFIPFIMAGDPDLDTTRSALIALDEAGADVIELGVPYSDPLADGPTIQSSGTRALARGTSQQQVLQMCKEVAPKLQAPIVLFQYFNPMLRCSVRVYCERAKDAGAAGLLVPDIPFEETAAVREAANAVGLELVLLTTPTTAQQRAADIAQTTQGFLYLVSVAGVTGSRAKIEDRVQGLIEFLHSVSDKPVAVGFGVSTPEQATKLVDWGAEGVVVGSALVAKLGEAATPKEGLQAMTELAGRLRDAIA